MSGRGPRLFPGIKQNAVTVTIDGSLVTREAFSYVTILGKQYNNTASVDVPPGTVLHAFADSMRKAGEIYLDGVLVASGYGATYDYIVEHPTSVTLRTVGSSTATVYGKVEISTE